MSIFSNGDYHLYFPLGNVVLATTAIIGNNFMGYHCRLHVISPNSK